jgi:hypothetical protein
VRIEAAERPRSLTACNCSICRRLAALWAYYTREQVRVIAAPGAISAYVWGDRCIEFYHCVTCGFTTHYESVEKAAGSRIAINGRGMPPEEIASMPVRRFDGAVSWRYLDE